MDPSAPTPTPLSKPFWDATQRSELVVQQCDACGLRSFPPGPACPACFATGLTWVRSPGDGIVYTFTVVHRAPRPGFDVPFVLAVVDLDDGWSMLTHVVDCSPESVSIGMRVHVRFKPVSGEITLPVFAPTS